VPPGSTGLGYYPVNGQQNKQQIGAQYLMLRADYRSNVAPGRDRVFINGLFFVVRRGRIYSFLISRPKKGSAVFTLRDSDGQNVLVNVEIQ
jgi:hypothetical protein